MIMVFAIPSTGLVKEVQLKDDLVVQYRMSIEDMQKYYSPTLDRRRRTIHNQLAQPVVFILRQEFPDKDEQEISSEARHLVTVFLDQPSQTGQSQVRRLRDSGLLI